MDAAAIIPIDNDIYNRHAEKWWSDDGFASMLKHISNPWRVPYFKRILMQDLKINPKGKRALDVGCGGGILAEDFASMGFDVTGIDPSGGSIEAARRHAVQSGLKIDYRVGSGERLPFENELFDVVYCCDVLEHILHWEAVISEIARVLKPGGVFFYDTINRTTLSRVIFIKLGQEWRLTRFLPPNFHVWEMFIKPEELKASLKHHALEHRDIKGTKPPGNPLRMIMTMRRYNTGKISAAEFGRCAGGTEEGPNIAGNYMGYAVKPEEIK
jgi:2-polyprenyl-6-hydroxyphenyl methylase/3-demethylubiquinone-9 3-methyltransferase